ncbi:MAG: hypothetical protein FJ098_04800, partial [Deltaproteobacteria bacterium]|nr:hypothetical protein [Deltaproteobacteria bacterium]
MSCGSDGAGAGTGDVGEPREDASGGLVVDTALEPSTAAAGEPVAVTCVLEDDGLPVEGTTWDVLVEGTAAYTFDGADLVITEAGDFTVACVETSRDLADGSPASLTVTAGPAASVETEVSTHEAVVGEEVTVTCIVLDEFGNLSDQHVLIGVSPPEVGTLSGDAFTSEVAGSFEIACGDADGEPVDKTPETVVFLAGPLKHVLTTLADEAIPAGTFTEVTCSATDGFGNPVEEDGFEVEHDEELFLNDSDPSEIGGVKAGVWEVTCVLADGGEATLHPADLEITALDPAGLQLLLTPAKPVYQVGDQVTVGFTLVDKYDNPVPGGEIDDPTYDPPDTLLELTSPKVFVFLAEGMVLVSSCVQDAPEWCDSVEAWCDGTAPLLSLTWPERGATLTGDAEVMVTGTVHEEVSSLASFTINGVDVVPAEDGSFSFPMDSAHGLNVIDAAAADVFGNASTAKRSYLFSKQYIPMDFAAPLASLVDEGVLLRLDDSLFAGEPGDPNNLTAILQSLLTEMDLNALIPSPVAEDQDLSVLCLWDTFDIYIDGITYGPPTVSLASAVGGIQLTLDLPDFHANFSVETDGFGCMDYVGTIHANVHFEALIVLAVTPDGLLDILVEDPVATFEDLNVDLTGVSGFLLNWLIDWVTGPLTAIMETLVMTQIQDLIGGLVDSLNETLAEPIQLPIDGFFEGMEQVVLNILLRFDHSKFLPEGGELGLDLAIFSEKKIDRDPLGAMARAACNQPTPEVFQFDEDAQVELAAYLDVVNEALFALWWNGMLNLHLTAEALAGLGVDVSEYGVVGLILDTQALLPPVITSCNPEGQLKAQVGDLYAEASFTMMGIPADIHMYLYLVLGADFAVVDGEEGKEIGITVHDPDKVLVDIAYVNDEWKGKEWMLTSLITDTLVPLLMESLQEEPLSFAIPPISLGDLGGGEPGEEPAIPLPAKDLILDL